MELLAKNGNLYQGEIMRLKTQLDQDNLHVSSLEEQIRAKEIGFGNAIDSILKGEQ